MVTLRPASRAGRRLRGQACWREGLRRGDRVGLLAENSPFFVAAYLGGRAAGLCAVPLPVDGSEPTLRRMVAATGMKRIFVSARLLPGLQPLADELGVGCWRKTAFLRPLADASAGTMP